MKQMKIFRIESLEIIPGERQTIHDVTSIINKTQDLEVISSDPMVLNGTLIFTVKRELELYPDSIK